jgi:hypothetical protein
VLAFEPAAVVVSLLVERIRQEPAELISEHSQVAAGPAAVVPAAVVKSVAVVPEQPAVVQSVAAEKSAEQVGLR